MANYFDCGCSCLNCQLNYVCVLFGVLYCHKCYSGCWFHFLYVKKHIEIASHHFNSDNIKITHEENNYNNLKYIKVNPNTIDFKVKTNNGSHIYDNIIC